MSRSAHIAIWALSGLSALLIGMLEVPRFFVLNAILGKEAAYFRAMWLVAEGKGTDWFVVILLFPVFLLFGYFVPAYVPLPGVWGEDRKREG